MSVQHFWSSVSVVLAGPEGSTVEVRRMMMQQAYANMGGKVRCHCIASINFSRFMEFVLGTFVAMRRRRPNHRTRPKPLSAYSTLEEATAPV